MTTLSDTQASGGPAREQPFFPDEGGRSPGMGWPKAREAGVGRCPNCQISIRVAGRMPQPDCPFCHGLLERSQALLPAPPAGEQPRADRRQAAARYRKPSRLLVLLLIAVSIVLLTVAIYFKLFNLRYFWYQPYINTYSLCVGVFILSRFILALFYSPPRAAGYEPKATVIIACRNEEDSIGETLRHAFSEGYPADKIEVVVVNDGSTDETLKVMMASLAEHPNLTVVDFEANKGKRHGMAVGALLARGEVLICVDSDSFLLPGAIATVVRGLADPTVAAVAGHTDVENAGANLLTKMQDVRYYFSYRVMKAAESLFGAVSCCPGCFSAYRKSCVLAVLDPWLNQRFLGRRVTFGDDRSLTNFLLRRYRVLYDCEALATTLVPERWGKYIRQQCRWKRSWIRELLVAGRFFWRKHPVAAISWYAMSVLPLLAPLVMFNALVLGPLLYGRPAAFYVGGVLVVTLLWSFYYLEKTGRPYWWTAFLFTLTYMGFFSWQGYYAVITMRNTKWGTR